MEAHFFDINTLIEIEGKVWIVSKDNPNTPILKIEPHEMKLMESGIWRKFGNKIDFNGKVFWLSNDFFNKVKIKAKNLDLSINQLAISLQEFYNKAIVEEKEFKINLEILDSIKNKEDHVYLICSKQTESVYKKHIEILKEKMREEGIVIKNFYFLNRNMWGINDDENNFKKTRLILQHAIGLKTDGDKFTDENIPSYSKINYYDCDLSTISLYKNINSTFDIILTKTPKSIRDMIKEKVSSEKILVTFNKVNTNEVNRIDEYKTFLKVTNDIRTFESFVNLFCF